MTVTCIRCLIMCDEPDAIEWRDEAVTHALIRDPGVRRYRAKACDIEDDGRVPGECLAFTLSGEKVRAPWHSAWHQSRQE